ncbi:MAG: serine/threonine-protein kinase [Planctomycetia bacterium]
MDRAPERAWSDADSRASHADRGLTDGSDGFGLRFDDPLIVAPGTVLGGATILRLLGEGGMGRVYEARQAAPDRLVAVKMLRDAIVSREQLQRFGYEAEVLGRLRHPHVAQIFTSGVHQHGAIAVPFFIMELIPDARPITLHAAECRLDLRARVELFRRVCDAVAHGHRKGVIHRDLKPANILVDSAGDPKVIDFGVARSTAPHAAHAPPRTLAGQRIGTLLYMSPEQLDGRVDEIDARTDVYALGLVLHELVAGQLPHDVQGTSLLEAARTVQDVGPRAARAVERAAVAAGCGRFAARSLAAIVNACLAANPADRYATALEVAAELARWTQDEPVLARPPTWGESVGRLVRRHRAAAVATVVAAVSLATAFVGISVFSLTAARKAAEARAELYHATVLLAAEARDRDSLPEARRQLAAAEALVADAGGRRPIELECLAASLDDSIAVVPGHAADVLATAWSPDGMRLATGARDGSARIVAAPGTDGAVVELLGHEADVWRITWSPDGAQVATASADKTVRIWDAVTGREQRRITGHNKRMYGVDFSGDGEVIATSGADHTARLWDVATGAEIRVLAGHGGTVFSIELSRDGRMAATASQDGTVRLWNIEDGTVLRTLTGHDDWVFHAALAPDGTRLATASEDGTVKVWSVASGRCTKTLVHPLRVNSVAFTADGQHVATASHDAVLRVFAVGSGREVRRLRAHDAAIWTVACAAQGNRIATGSGDHTTRIWTADGACAPVVKAGAAVRAVAWSPDGGLIVGDGDSTIRVHDGSTLTVRRQLSGTVGAIHDVALFNDGRRLAAACDDGSVRLLDVDDRHEAQNLVRHVRAVHAVALSPDGTLLATASEDGTATIRELASPDVATHVLPHGRRATCARFAPDGRTLYTAGAGHHASAWDVVTGHRLRDFVGHEGAVMWVAVSADGARLATASADGTVGLWRAGDARLLHRLHGPGCEFSKVAFAPDGSRVAAVSADGATHLWDPISGRPFPILRGHVGAALAVAFAPDGSVLATGGADETVRLEGRSTGDVFRRRLTVSRGSR